MITPDDLKVLKDRILKQKLDAVILAHTVRFLIQELKGHEIWNYEELREAWSSLTPTFVLEFTSGIVSDGPTIIEQPESDFIAFLVDAMCLCGIRNGEAYLKSLGDCDDYINTLEEIGQVDHPSNTAIVMGFGALTVATGTPPSDRMLKHMFFNPGDDDELHNDIVAVIDELVFDRVRLWVKQTYN